jgi:iron complex outermembrane recepter protein
MNPLLLVASFFTLLFAYQRTSAQQDSVRLLDVLLVTAYKNDRPLNEVPAAVGVVTNQMLARFGNTSLLPAVNTVPGVRMEERSPGSYRFSVRGSLLRSPFGVRNVKFYWNGLPLTDGGGNTYLNLLDFNSIGSMEIIKGPAASLYGAGTGGVVLLTSPTLAPAFKYDMQVGSFGLFRTQIGGTLVSTEKNSLAVRTSFQRSDGYREHTEMKRITAGADWSYSPSERTRLSTTFLTSRLFYETPGGLTKLQYELDPRQARPSTATIPGAVSQKAAVTNTTHYLSSLHEYEWNNEFLFRTGLFASLTQFKNSSIRNYESREERNWGGRAEIQYTCYFGTVKSKSTFGGEYQYFYSPLSVYDNAQGRPADMQTQDKLRSTGGLFFLQTELDLPAQFILTVGGSLNFLRYGFERLFPQPVSTEQRTFTPSLFPRIALLKKFNESLSIYGNISNGFSPPSLAEVRPSTGAYNNSLQAERGTNIEVGIRGKTLANRFHFDLVAYTFRLKETIVIQREADGAEYFTNAGETLQQGVELTLQWTPFKKATRGVLANTWLSYALNAYTFSNYVNDGIDYSKNEVTGVAPNVISYGLDLSLKKGMYTNITVNYTDHTPLNDANTEYASYYWLVGARIGYKKEIRKTPIAFFLGIDNATDEKYSLGNDLNATGGRYYNTAPGRNYYAGVSVKFRRTQPTS